jgi:nucleosome binding factor SPN SPT16 subunit
MAEIKIDKDLFQERLAHFYSAWKADKRSGDAVFGGASSILVLMGKTEESVQFQKNNAFHVSRLTICIAYDCRLTICIAYDSATNCLD